MSPEDAAQKWIDANPDKVNAWLKLTDATLAGLDAATVRRSPRSCLVDRPGGRSRMLDGCFV